MTKVYQVGDWLKPEDDEYRDNVFYKVGTNIEVEYLGAIYNNYGDYTLVFKDKLTEMELKIKNNELPQYIQYEPKSNNMSNALYGNINNTDNLDIQKMLSDKPIKKLESFTPIDPPVKNKNVKTIDNTEHIQENPKHETEFTKLLKKAKLERANYEFQLVVPKLSFIKIILDSMDFSETEKDNALDSFAEYVWLKNKDEIKLTLIESLQNNQNKKKKIEDFIVKIDD